MTENWYHAFRIIVNECGKQAVADRLDYSRSTVRLVMNNKYTGNMERFADRVRMKLLGYPASYVAVFGALADLRNLAEGLDKQAEILSKINFIESKLLEGKK